MLWRYLLQLALNDERLLRGESAPPLDDPWWRNQIIGFAAGSSSRAVDARGFLASLRTANTAAIELGVRAQAHDLPWPPIRHAPEDLVLIVKPQGDAWVAHHWHESPVGWRTEVRLEPADLAPAQSIGDALTDLRATLDDVGDYGDEALRSDLRSARDLLAGEVDELDGYRRPSVPPVRHGTSTETCLMAGLQRLLSVGFGGVGRLDDMHPGTPRDVARLRLAIAHGLAALSRH